MFEEIQNEYYRLTKQNITAEEVLENILRTIDELDKLVEEVKSNIDIAKSTLKIMYNCVKENRDCNVNVEYRKITINVLEKLGKNKSRTEEQKIFTRIIAKMARDSIDNRSKQKNYNRKNRW